MIEPHQLGPCARCENLLEFGKANRSTEHLDEVGNPIRFSKALGTGMATTTRFLQCPDCGQLWQEVDDVGFQDGGFGGSSKALYYLDIIR